MEVSVLTDDLAEPAVELWERVGLVRPWNEPRADLARALNGPASTVLGGLEQEQLIATVMVGHDGHRGWVYYLAVAPDRRRRGHGSRMLEAAERWLVERRIPKLNLMVRNENDPARTFYDALGFRQDEVIVLSRRLSPPGPPT